ncbi:MAG: glycoside hydrolase family 36 protein [Anaerolineales bacterium]
MSAKLAERLTIVAEKSRPAPDGGFLLNGAEVEVELPFEPVRYLVHGWQSWSLATWLDPARSLPPQKPRRLHPMQLDPAYASLPRPHGSWLGAVETPEDGILLLGALGLEAHVELDGRRLRGRYESGSGEWFVGAGDETTVFSRYADMLEKRFGKGRVERPPRVWCSWYSLYTAIDENILHQALNDLANLPFDVFQVDDGWQRAIGDWEPNAKFPSGMDVLSARIQASGRTAGLWLAPLIVVPSAPLYQQHPDWLLRDEKGNPVSAGFNWGEPLFALDTTHPAVLEWLAALMQKVRGWGYDYLKLDFLYAGALPGKRYLDLPRETAYRNGLKVLREAMGDAYFLTCGAPILPSIGLCDGMRIGPDVADIWIPYRDAVLLANPTVPGGQNALRTSLHRLWLAPLLHTDPDVVYFRSQRCSLSPQEKSLLQDLSLVAGFRATSDLPRWWTDEERQQVRAWLERRPRVKRLGRYLFKIDDREVDFGPHIELPPAPQGWQKLQGNLFGWLGSQAAVLRALHKNGQRLLQKMRAENS